MSSAAVSLASTQPPSVLPSTSGRKPWRSRTPNRCASSISTSENAPASRGSTFSSACSRSRPSERSSSPYSRGEQLADELAVGGEHAGQHAELGRELLGVGEVAVVAEREPGVGDRAVDGLRVAPRARTGRGVADVTDREVTLERREPALVEHLRDETHVLDDRDRLAVADRDAGRLLAAVLQGVEAEVRVLGEPAGRVRTRRRLRTRLGARKVRVQGHQYFMSGSADSESAAVRPSQPSGGAATSRNLRRHGAARLLSVVHRPLGGREEHDREHRGGASSGPGAARSSCSTATRSASTCRRVSGSRRPTATRTSAGSAGSRRCSPATAWSR